MLKKIHVRDVRSGMFIHEICGSWMEHPFWKRAFLLTADEDLKTLQTCGIQEVWIDTEKGLDVATDVAAPSAQEEEKKVDAELSRVANEARAVPRVPIRQEVQRARAVLSKGRAAVTSMFNEIRMGKAIRIGDAEPLVNEISNSIARNPEAFLNLARLKDVEHLHALGRSQRPDDRTGETAWTHRKRPEECRHCRIDARRRQGINPERSTQQTRQAD
jgi:hypothetical protein